MTRPDPERVAAIIRDVAATEMLPRFRKLAQSAIRQKAPNDFVTEVDEISEARLTAALGELLPGSVVVGEEGAAADPAVLGRLSGDHPVWVIDPLDGTFNYAHGDDRFACIVALVEAGRTVMGWIHDPIRGMTGVVEIGSGCWIDGRRTAVAAPKPVGEAAVVCSFPSSTAPLRRALREAARVAGRHINNRCAGIDYLMLAGGQAEYGVHANLKPWDHAAGVLMHAEAGGYSAVLVDGAPYRPTRREGGLILAPDRASWQALRDLLGPLEA